MHHYRHVWVWDFEFFAPDGHRPHPLCVVARELFSGRRLALWLGDGAPPAPPWPSAPDVLMVGFYTSAELGCHIALGWPIPLRILDLYAEFRDATSGLPAPGGHGLLGALMYYGLPGLAAAEKEDMRRLAQRGGPYSPQEKAALLQYCQSDVDALAALLPTMLPQLDLGRALLRGRYTAAAARIEWNGVPLDTEMLAQLRDHWEPIRTHLAQTINHACPVFVPAGLTIPDPTSSLGAAVLTAAETSGLDPLHLMWAVEQVWQEMRDLYSEGVQARKAARRLTGLSTAVITRWEQAGHDHSSWPGLDDMASELAASLPGLGIGQAETVHGGPDIAAQLWALLRDTDERLLAKTHPQVLARALELLEADPEGEVWTGPFAFSEYRFERYLHQHDIPWSRLPSGRLALDDQTFREMARSYPGAIGPIRDVRDALAKLKLHRLAVGPDGRNRTLLSVFGSRTGRNQPSASRFIFSPSTWLRCLITPPEGHALAYVDWSQQELAIAAYLSGDQAMMETYAAGDFYLEFAKRVGAAPPDATKDTHAEVRDAFKVVSLGVLYGLSELGLARRLSIAPCEARELLRQHRTVFRTFWQWSDTMETQGMLGYSLSTVFGWHLHSGPDIRPRTLRNFAPQANAAEMMRLACCLTTEHGIQVDAVIHDALLVEARNEEIETVVADTQHLMQRASELVCPGFPLRTEVKMIRYPDRYTDKRGVHMWETVQNILSDLEARVPF
jgi:hypothetical protein